jgi:hypothetical protein
MDGQQISPLYSGRKMTESLGNVTVREEERWNERGYKGDYQQSV